MWHSQVASYIYKVESIAIIIMIFLKKYYYSLSTLILIANSSIIILEQILTLRNIIMLVIMTVKFGILSRRLSKFSEPTSYK